MPSSRNRNTAAPTTVMPVLWSPNQREAMTPTKNTSAIDARTSAVRTADARARAFASSGRSFVWPIAAR